MFGFFLLTELTAENKGYSHAGCPTSYALSLTFRDAVHLQFLASFKQETAGLDSAAYVGTDSCCMDKAFFSPYKECRIIYRLG